MPRIADACLVFAQHKVQFLAQECPYRPNQRLHVFLALADNDHIIDIASVMPDFQLALQEGSALLMRL